MFFVSCFFFLFAKNHEVLCFISFPKMILLFTAALTFNLDEKADKSYGRFTTFSFAALFSWSLWAGTCIPPPARGRWLPGPYNGQWGMEAPFG